MKQILSAILGLMMFTCVSAQVDQNDITMVSYDHSCMEERATVLLKNNIEETITSVCFKITYMDMSGHQLDSLWFYHTMSMKSGKTQKLDVHPYKHNKGYHYYKSEGDAKHAYKIAYELMHYNAEKSGWHGQSDEVSANENGGRAQCLSPLIVILPILFIFITVVGLFAWLCWLLVKWIRKRKT